jgi:hypothetical protein
MPHFLKRKEYIGESEVRFVTSGPGNRSKPGILVELPPRDWIEEIVLSPKLNRSEEQALKDVVKNLVPGVPCSKSNLLREKNRTQLSLGELRASSDESAEVAWRDGSDGIPSIVKEI